MKKTILLFTVFLLSTFVVNAQYFDWAKSFNIGTKSSSMAIDHNGYIYISSTKTSDNFNTENYNYDFSITKIDTDGTTIWNKKIGGEGPDIVNSITVDIQGNTYTTGSFYGKVNFDPNIDTTYLSASGSNDMFIQKLDSDGNLVWAKSLGVGTGYLIEVNSMGELYSVRVHSTNPYSPTYALQKFDAHCNLLWEKELKENGINMLSVHSLVLGDTENIYVGYNIFTYPTGFGYKYSSNFIKKIDPNGNLIWKSNIGEMSGTGDPVGIALKVDALENIYTVGTFDGTVNFDPNEGSNNLTTEEKRYQVFLQKLNTDGDFVWVKSMPGIGGKERDWSHLSGLAITLDTSNNIYLTGNFDGTVDFNPTEDTTYLTAQENDAFIQKLNKNGSFLWVKSIAIANIETITTDLSGNLYSVGSFQNTVDFDPNEGTYHLTSESYRDLFLQKLTNTPKIETPLGIEPLKQSKIKLYPNPTNNLLNIELPTTVETAQFSIVNYMGQIVRQGNLNRSKKVVNLSSLSAGIYQVNMILSSGEKYFEKIVLTK